MQKRMITIGVAACVLALIVAGVCMAQPPAGGGRGTRGQGDRGGPGQGTPGQGGRFDPAQMRQMMVDRMKERLGVDDQAWKVMEPRLTKVMELNRQASGGGRGMFGMFGGSSRGGQRPGQPGGQQGPQGQQRELSATEKALQQLEDTLAKESASPEEIKKQLTALRTAREQAKQQLAAAQQSLREILTLRQEAQLVTMSILD